MNNSSELKSSLASLVYTLIPFLLLLITKIYSKKYAEILITADWGLAASLLFGQSQAKIISAGLLTKKTTNNSGYQLYNALRITYLITALCTFTLMTINPNFWLALFQLSIFIFSLFIYLKDSLASEKINS